MTRATYVHQGYTYRIVVEPQSQGHTLRFRLEAIPGQPIRAEELREDATNQFRTDAASRASPSTVIKRYVAAYG